MSDGNPNNVDLATPWSRDDLVRQFGDRHPSVRAVLNWFAYDHLPEHLRPFSAECCRTARFMVEWLPDSPELTVGLRKLLEAKDAFVRAALERQS